MSEDPTRVSRERIAGLEILGTIIGGEIRYATAGLGGGPAGSVAERAGEVS